MKSSNASKASTLADLEFFDVFLENLGDEVGDIDKLVLIRVQVPIYRKHHRREIEGTYPQTLARDHIFDANRQTMGSLPEGILLFELCNRQTVDAKQWAKSSRQWFRSFEK